jgi:hypothetical protein
MKRRPVYAVERPRQGRLSNRRGAGEALVGRAGLLQTKEIMQLAKSETSNRIMEF